MFVLLLVFVKMLDSWSQTGYWCPIYNVAIFALFPEDAKAWKEIAFLKRVVSHCQDLFFASRKQIRLVENGRKRTKFITPPPIYCVSA